MNARYFYVFFFAHDENYHILDASGFSHAAFRELSKAQDCCEIMNNCREAFFV